MSGARVAECGPDSGSIMLMLKCLAVRKSKAVTCYEDASPACVRPLGVYNTLM